MIMEKNPLTLGWNGDKGFDAGILFFEILNNVMFMEHTGRTQATLWSNLTVYSATHTVVSL